MKPRPLVVASAGAFASALSTSLVAVSVPVIAREMAVTPAEASWVLSAYLLAISCLLALAGKAADVLGRRRVYLVGFAFFVAGSAACALAPTLGTLVGARVVQGVGAAMLMAIGPAIVTRSVPPERRARGLGIQLAATYVGLTLGPSLGGLLSAHVHWQAIFVVVAAVGLVTALFAIRLLPADAPSASSAELDLGGAALFAIALGAVIVALKRTAEDGWTGRPVLVIAGIALVTFLAFVLWEAKRSAPVLPLHLFRELAFAFGVVGATLLYTVMFILSYALTFELQRGAGLTASRAGAFMTTQPAVMAITAPLSGVLADRWGPRVPSTIGMIAIGGGLGAIGMGPVFRSSHAPGLPLVLSLALVGFGAGLYVAPNTALIMGAAPRDRQAIAGAMTATARNVGMTLGIALSASLGASIGFRRTLLVASGLAGFAACLGLVRPVARNRA